MRAWRCKSARIFAAATVLKAVTSTCRLGSLERSSYADQPWRERWSIDALRRRSSSLSQCLNMGSKGPSHGL